MFGAGPFRPLARKGVVLGFWGFWFRGLQGTEKGAVSLVGVLQALLPRVVSDAGNGETAAVLCFETWGLRPDSN